MAAPATEAKKGSEPEARPAVPAHLHEEILLKFVGTATLILGVVLLISSSIAIAVLSILRFDLGPWLPILPLSLLIVLIGGLLNVYFRKVIDRELNPKKYEQPRPSVGYPYSYPMPPYYATRIPAPTMPAPMYPQAPGAGPGPRGAPPQMATAPAKFCIQCGRRIPVEAKFCPYCRRAYPA